MKEAKIRLSAKEMELITKADWILTKNEALLKIEGLLASLQLKQKEFLADKAFQLPIEFFNSTPKISKGENYLGLPYRILDYPKIFNQSEIIAIRTMFWWGNFFSITLHLSGTYKSLYEEKIIQAKSLLGQDQFYYCNNKMEWEHHFEESNYFLIDKIPDNDFIASVREREFCKLAFKLDLQQTEKAEEILMKKYKILIDILVN